MSVKHFGHRIAINSAPLKGPLAATWEACIIGDLYEIDRSRTGRCVLQLINAGTRTVTVTPYLDKDDPENSDESATNGQDGYYKARPVRGGDGKHDPAWGIGTGKGSDTVIRFTTWRYKSGNRAVMLLHEFVHASEDCAGTMYCNAMGWGFDSTGDFDTILVENIYRSEKHLKSRRNHQDWTPLKGQLVPDTPAYRKYVASFRSRLPALAKRLAHVDAPFNPFRKGAKGYVKL